MLDKIGEIITKVFGSKSEKDIKKIQPIVDEIKSYEEAMKKLSDDELKAKTQEFKQKIKDATAETVAEIKEIKVQLEDIENLSAAEHREMAEYLDELEQKELDTIEAVLDEILPEAFAVLKDTCRRFVGKSWKVGGNETTWEMIPYDVQLVGAIVLHQGKVAEMKTGEGKTLVAIFPAYLNALAEKGCTSLRLIITSPNVMPNGTNLFSTSTACM